ncbi:hypothetical protein IRJ41_015859, partial [Triplophysa rosa]
DIAIETVSASWRVTHCGQEGKRRDEKGKIEETCDRMKEGSCNVILRCCNLTDTGQCCGAMCLLEVFGWTSFYLSACIPSLSPLSITVNSVPSLGKGT